MKCEASQPGGFTLKECLVWASLIQPHVRYFEWGSGFTTRMADERAKSVISVEGSRGWYQHMTQTFALSKRTHIKYVNIGHTKAFSWPSNVSAGDEYIHSLCASPPQDVILVDGRWRVACALAALLCLPQDATLLVHDFGRRGYHVLLRFYELKGTVDSLVVLQPRWNVTMSALQQTLRRYSTNAER